MYLYRILEFCIHHDSLAIVCKYLMEFSLYEHTLNKGLRVFCCLLSAHIIYRKGKDIFVAGPTKQHSMKTNGGIRMHSYTRHLIEISDYLLALATLPPRRGTNVMFWITVGFASHQLWMLWRSEKCFFDAENRTPFLRMRSLQRTDDTDKGISLPHYLPWNKKLWTYLCNKYMVK
jgi:hypothetical protein